MKEYVTKPLETDIFSSRGRNAFRHPGNERFRRVIVSHIERYKSATMRTEKSAIVEAAFNEILGYGGRFLKKDWDNGKQWYVLEKKEARSKVAHTLRDCVTDRIKSIWAAKDGTTVEWADPPRPEWSKGANGQRRRKRVNPATSKKKKKKAPTSVTSSTTSDPDQTEREQTASDCVPEGRATSSGTSAPVTGSSKPRRRRLPARKRYLEQQQDEEQQEHDQRDPDQTDETVQLLKKPTPQFISQTSKDGVAALRGDGRRGLHYLNKTLEHALSPLTTTSTANGSTSHHHHHHHHKHPLLPRTVSVVDEDDLWCTMFVRLVQFKAKFGHVQVPPDYESDPELAYWVEEQRLEQRKHDRGLASKMTKPRFDKLGALKFVWKAQQQQEAAATSVIFTNKTTTWNARFAQLRRYWTKHGRRMWIDEPFREDRELSDWVDIQRAEVAKVSREGTSTVITDEAMVSLEQIHFPGAIKLSSRRTREDEGDESERPAAHLLLQALRNGGTKLLSPDPSPSTAAPSSSDMSLSSKTSIVSSESGEGTPPDDEPVFQTGLGARHRQSIQDAMLLAELNRYGFSQKALAAEAPPQDKEAPPVSAIHRNDDERDDNGGRGGSHNKNRNNAKQAPQHTEEEGPSFWTVSSRPISSSNTASTNTTSGVLAPAPAVSFPRMEKTKSETTTTTSSVAAAAGALYAEADGQEERRSFPCWRRQTSPVPQALPY